MIISLTGFYVYYTATDDNSSTTAISPTLAPAPPLTTVVDYAREVEEVKDTHGKMWLDERQELQRELRRAYDAAKREKERAAEDRRALDRLQGDIGKRDQRIQRLLEEMNTAREGLREESSKVHLLEDHIASLEAEVSKLQADVRTEPAEEVRVEEPVEDGRIFNYVISAALGLLALVEILAARTDSRLRVGAIQAEEQAQRLTTALEEASAVCEVLSEEKRSLSEQLEKALHDKEDNALALSDALATLASSRDEFTRFSEEQAKRESALLDRLADSQSAMSSARSMASQAFDLKLASSSSSSHDVHQPHHEGLTQQQEQTGKRSSLDGKPVEWYSKEDKEASTCPPSNVSSAVCCPPADGGREEEAVVVRRQYSATTQLSTGGSASDVTSPSRHPLTPIMLPTFTPAGKATTTTTTQACDTAAAAAAAAADEPQDASTPRARTTKGSDDSSGGVAEAVGGLASPRRAASSVVPTPLPVRYDPYEEEPSWLTAGGSPEGVVTPSSITHPSPGPTDIPRQEELSPLKMETPARDTSLPVRLPSSHEVRVPDVVSNLEALLRSKAVEGMSPLDVVSEAPSVNRTAAVMGRRKRPNSIDRTCCPMRTPRTNSPKKSTPASTPTRGPGIARSKAHPKASINRLPLDRLSFTTGATTTTTGYSRRQPNPPESARVRRGSTGSMDHNTESKGSEDGHRCAVPPGSGGGVVTKVPHPYSDMSVSVSVGGVHGTAASSLHDTSSLLLHLRPGTISEAVGNVRESRLHQCVQIIKASDFGSRCSDKRYTGWVSSICRHEHDKDAVAAALCDIATQSISSGGSMDPHRCARVLKVIEDFIDKGNWIMESAIILLQRCIRPGDFSSGMVHLTQSLLPFLHANTDAFISKKEVKLCQATFYKFATLLPCYIEYKDTSTVPTQNLATQCESLLTKFWDKSRPWIAAIGRDLIRVLLPISKCQGVSEIWYMLTTGDTTGRRLAKVCSLSTPYWLHRHLISPTEEEELSSLFTAFIAGSQKQMQDQYFERSFKAEGLLLRHHVIHTTRAVLCGNLHNLDTEVSRNSMIPPQQRVFRWHFLGWLALIAGQFMTIEEQAYFRLSLFIDCLLGAVGDPIIMATPTSPSTRSSEDGGNSNNSIVDEDTLVKSLVDGRDRLIPTSYREWDPHLPPPITPPPKGGKDKPTILDGFMPVHDLIYEELPTERSVAVPLLVVLGLSIDHLLPSAASAKLTRLNLATSVSETLFQCAVETLRRGRDYSNDTLVGRVETLSVTARLPRSLKVCFDAVSKAIDKLCFSREEYETPEWLDKTPRAVLQRIILPDPAPPPLPAANNDDLEGPVMEDSWDEEGNYSEISDTDDGTASVMTEAATFPEPTPAEQAPASEADQNRVQQPSVADGAIDQATSNTAEMRNGVGNSPENGNGGDKSKGSKVMELLMLLQKGQQG
ncbi:Integrator complex subunit 3 [Perkinsus olseni]|nr:Integrator complex subunit 3 [Perkinsus olseni]